ncbi:MAG: hypothetical protein ACSLFQ_17385 [Thermoanaerobaculia bacterium]
MLTKLRAKTLLRGTANTIEIVSDRVEFSVERFLDGLEERDAKQMLALLAFVAEHGAPVNVEKNRPLGDGSFELKTKRVRLFWFR